MTFRRYYLLVIFHPNCNLRFTIYHFFNPERMRFCIWKKNTRYTFSQFIFYTCKCKCYFIAMFLAVKT